MDASIEIIESVKDHPNADRLDLVEVLGYQCVTEKGLYSAGDIICYTRTDTVLPEEEWTEGYRKYAPKRVKAVRLRGFWSEGILVPLEFIQDKFDFGTGLTKLEGFLNIIGSDISEIIGVKHYEPPIPQDLSAKGGLPYSIPKTDEKRAEEKKGRLPLGEKVDISLKIDGQSSTFFYNLEEDYFGVTGRSMEYKEDTVNNYTQNAKKYDIENKLRAYCQEHGVSLALRGEQYGAGIQGSENNPHSKENLNLAIFSVYNITNACYENKDSDLYFENVAAELQIPTVPIVERDVVLTQELIDKYAKELKKLNGKMFEGVVVKHSSGTFKIINKNYDSKK